MLKQQEAVDLVQSIEPTIERLMQEHIDRREHWYFHDYVPWEQGRSFADEPWHPSQASLQPEVRTALVLNLLTEDNLPYYYSLIQGHFDHDFALNRWSRLWTAEEGQHAIAMRSYLLTSRNCDPKLLEDERMTVMQDGYFANWADAASLFVYTAAQELATRISHRNAGVKADCEIAHGIMSRVARDENHHFIFYRGVATELFGQAPDAMVQAANDVMQNFQMPGTGIPGFQRKALKMARLGIYNLRIHAENILEPLIKHWKIADLTDLSPEGAKAQEELMALVPDLLVRAEQFERRQNRRAKVPASV